MASAHCFPYRPHDYMYDPIFTVSGPVDHYKAAMVAKMSTAKFQICPIFPNMFSDLPNHPRVQLVRRRQTPRSTYNPKTKVSRAYDPALHRKVDVLGADRLKYFCPVLNFPTKDALPYHQFTTFTIDKIEKKATSKLSDKTRDVQVETKFRESTAQTEPWEPPYKIIGKGDPEILKLDFLKWGSGLPAGMHEVQLIERARMKAAWQKAIMPDISDENSLTQFRNYLEALERDEWAFREQEIGEIQDLRLQLLEKMLNEIHEKSNTRSEQKLHNLVAKKQSEKEEQLTKIRRNTERELRKLESQRRGLNKRYHEMNIIDEHTDKKSEIYGPLIRHGEHPKRWHQVIDEKLKKYKAQFIGVEHFSTLPRWLNQATKVDKRDIHTKSAGRGLCIKETKWSAPVLKELHEELKNLRKETVKRPLSLRTRVEIRVEESNTPEVEGIPQQEEDKYQALVLLQKVIRGRAAQMMIYEGRDTCKELIQELKHSVGLLKKQKELRTKQKLKVKQQQREEFLQLNMVQSLQGTLGKLQGSIVGTLLDFLNKELRRLLEERKAHAMCMVNERERFIREAAEAGRRQKEIRRRREHDEMFKQVVKITQESVDVYLQDIITEGMELSSKEEGVDYVSKLAEKIDKETDEAYEESAKITIDEQDEIIANMVHHFILPDVEKKLVRTKINLQQKQNLRTVHDSIYSRFKSLPKIEKHEEKAEPKYEAVIEELTKQSEEDVHKLENEKVKEEYQDPIEQYLTQLMNENQAFDEFPTYEDINDETSECQFRHDALDTITEVDENSSKKE